MKRQRSKSRQFGPADDGRFWIFGLHAVREALENPARQVLRLVLTLNAAQKLKAAVETSGISPEMSDARKFAAPLEPQSVHQGAAALVLPLNWGEISAICAPHATDPAPLALLLDRVTDPHNVGAVLRSAEVFGARAVIAPYRHSPPETGALAKAASGAMERQPYLRVRNLAAAMAELKELSYTCIGLDDGAGEALHKAALRYAGEPLALVLGAEGPGLRELTRSTCDALVKIPAVTEFASLNVSNAAAVALYAARTGRMNGRGE